MYSFRPEKTILQELCWGQGKKKMSNDLTNDDLYPNLYWLILRIENQLHVGIMCSNVLYRSPGEAQSHVPVQIQALCPA